jgi:hypothetical protein
VYTETDSRIVAEIFFFLLLFPVGEQTRDHLAVEFFHLNKLVDYNKYLLSMAIAIDGFFLYLMENSFACQRGNFSRVDKQENIDI